MGDRQATRTRPVGPEGRTPGQGDLPAAAGGAASFLPWLAEVVGAVLTGRRPHAPVGPGDLIAVSATGTVTRHRVVRTFRCRLCGGSDRPLLTGPDVPPGPLVRQRHPSPDPVPTRSGAPFGLDPDRMRAALGDGRFGPLVRVARNAAGAFPLVEAELLAGTPAGAGRAVRFREAEAIAVLEAYERLGGYPHAAPIVPQRTRRELGDLALDPTRLGGYTDRQLAAPTCRIRPYHEDAPLDWVWGRPLDGSAPRLVPAEVGFYRYGYGLRGTDPRPYFLESSSGSALGNSLPEAALHSLLELAERDAFLLAWHRRRPLPTIDPDSLTDPDCRMMLRLARARGYDVHLLKATADIDVPVVWALAIHRDRALPASFSTAGCHPDPVAAARAALWELCQLVAAGLAWDPAEVEPMVTDPWLVEDIAHHWRRYTFPQLLPRVETVLGGPVGTVEDAFPDWPQQLSRAADGDVTGALEFVAGRFAAAGLDDILVVDQSTPDHTAAGLTVVKCVVPGIVPMCFGQAHQRLSGLPRLRAALGPDADDRSPDPHPFP
ncbi:YcaO-like family protein [Micromonospora sp. R77]|uniref:YcaO-like family protein n=1 Tax=Micromonospora sp. R77 TaxID=2925836 RepID=UPI001F624CF1|nr:YcaO-like family protein [Micromonospora sp. R77]MCI4061354.1 YcaO-like family protein [Micromonospora sp. R77]